MADKAHMADKGPEHRLVVVMEGGLVMGVYSADPSLIGLKYTTVDYDVEGLGPDDPVVDVPQDGGGTAEAYVRHHRVERCTIGTPAWKPEQF